MNSLCIKIFDDSPLENKSHIISNGLFNEHKEILSNVSSLNIDSVIFFYASAKDDFKNCMRTLSPEISLEKNSFKISYDIYEHLPVISKAFKTEAKRMLVTKNLIERNEYIPNIFILSCTEVSEITCRDEIDDFLTQNVANKKWDEINSRFGDINDVVANEIIWNSPGKLDKLAMSWSKAATLSAIPREIRGDKNKKSELLECKKKWRNGVLKLRERCIELVSDNPAYYANLGYFYYNNCNELKAPGGRRDGNLVEEANSALHYYQLAFDLDTNRVKEHYRAGKIYCDVLYPQTLFNRKEGKDRFDIAKKMLRNGIDQFKTAISIYETLPDGSAQKKYFRKEYIHSLYGIADAYLESAGKIWDEEKYLVPKKFLEFETINNSSFNNQTEKIETAIAYIKKCIICDANNKDVSNVFDAAMLNGEYDAVFKLYKTGDLLLSKFILYTQAEIKDDELKKNVYRFLKAAYDVKWSQSRKNMKKFFVLERLARYFISAGEPEKAVKIFEKYPDFRGRVDSYVLNTISLAYKLNNNYQKALELNRLTLSDKYNKEEWISIYIKACCLIEQGKDEEALQVLEEAKKAASKSGKKNIESLLISSAHIHYHNGDIMTGLKFIEKAIEINPRRESALKKYIEWMNSPD